MTDRSQQLAALVDRLPNTFVSKKSVRGIIEQAGLEIDANGHVLGEFNRLLNVRRERERNERSVEIAAEREREAARKEFAKQGREAEIKLMAGVQPHWPTYRKVLALCDDVAEMFSAIKARDMGDVLATKGAVDELARLLLDLGVLEDGSAALAIWESVVQYHRISEAQSKALAIAAAKAATLAGAK